jgi:glycine dehydrogenase subunit 2
VAPFLPVPLVEGRGRSFFFQYDRPQSIGKVRTFYGNFGVLVAPGRTSAASARRDCARSARWLLNANYVMEGLRGLLDLPYGDRRCMHEFVGSATPLKRDGVRA